MLIRQFVFNIIPEFLSKVFYFNKKTLKEVSASTDIISKIVSLDPSRIRPSGKKNRVYAPDITSSEFHSLLSTHFTNIEQILPKYSESLSSKFITFSFFFEEKNYKVVLAKGKIAGADIEDTEILEFQKQIDSYNKDGKGISIRVGEKIYGGITTITKVGLNRKSDFYLSSKTTPLIFLQHKGPQHQQMSGIAKSPFSEHPEVISFVEEVREKVREEGRLRGIYSKEIIDSKLKMLAAYGTTSSEFNVNAVHLYCVGSLELVSVGDNLFEISADRIYTYPQIPDKEDKPMLGATFRTDRNQSGIPQTRLGIYPANYTC